MRTVVPGEHVAHGAALRTRDQWTCFGREGDNTNDTDHAEEPIKPCCRALHRVVTGILCDRLLRRKLRPSLSALPASRYELKYMHLVDEALATELNVPETHAHVPIEAEVHSPAHPADVLGSPTKGTY